MAFALALMSVSCNTLAPVSYNSSVSSKRSASHLHFSPSLPCVAFPCPDGLVSVITGWFLSCMDYVVGLTHYLSTVSMPWGSAAEISCVSAIYLALLVRLVVATVLSAVRVVLGLPVRSPAAFS